MSAATLLNADDSAFQFEHRMAHEAMLTAQAPASINFSALPYYLDPEYPDRIIPAGWANTLHVQAHADFLSLSGNAIGGNTSFLTDISLRPPTDPWWQFSNFQLHFIAAQAIG